MMNQMAKFPLTSGTAPKYHQRPLRSHFALKIETDLWKIREW